MSWKNPANNITSVSVVKSTSSVPTSPTDGTTIFQGLNDSFIDSNVSNGELFYAVFCFKRDSEFSEPAIIGINTELFSIAGIIKQNNSDFVENAMIVLKDNNGNILHTDYTNSSGEYHFINLNKGEYSIEATHPEYQIINPIREISIVDDSSVSNFEAVPLSNIEFVHDIETMYIDSRILITWKYHNINNQELVSISLTRDEIVEVIGDNIPIMQGGIEWLAKGPITSNAEIKISLKSNPSVYDILETSLLYKNDTTTIKGDLNGNFSVDLDDYYKVFEPSFKKCEGATAFNPICDLNGDKCVNLFDLQILYQYYLDYQASIN